MMPSTPGLLQNSESPGITQPTRNQTHEGMSTISPTLKKQQKIFNSSPQCPTSSHLDQNPQGNLGSVCQYPLNPKTTPVGVPLPRFCSHPLESQHLSPHQLRQPSMPRMPTVFNNAAWVVAAAALTTAVSRVPPPSQGDDSMKHHFGSNSVFAKVPTGVPPAASALPSQQPVVPPNQAAPGSAPDLKVSDALANPSFNLLGNQSSRQSPVRVPVPVLNTTKSLQQGMATMAPMSPIQGIEPPSYVAAAATAAAASAMAASQSLGPFNRTGTPPELPPDKLLPQPNPQPPLNGLISPPDGSEVDFIEALLKGSSEGPDEDWMCNLRLIDDILEQQAAVQNATAQNADQLTKGAGEL